MSQSPNSRRAFLLTALAATATAGAAATVATSVNAAGRVCVRWNRWRCQEWKYAPLPPKPDPKGIKLK